MACAAGNKVCCLIHALLASEKQPHCISITSVRTKFMLTYVIDRLPTGTVIDRRPTGTNHALTSSSEDDTASSRVGPSMGPLVLFEVVELFLVDSTPSMLPDESHGLDGIHIGKFHKSNRHKNRRPA